MSEHTAKPQARAAEKIWGVIEHHGTTGTVSFERRMNTSAEDLWEVVTAPDRLSRWFCAVSGELRLGGRYAADMGTDGLVSGRVLACDPPRSYRVSWDEGNQQESVIDVSVTMGDADDEAVLRLVHAGLPTDTLADYGAGWQGYLEVLPGTDTGRSEWSTARYRELLPRYQQRYPDAVPTSR